MKRIEQLQPLSREHHQSLILAQKAIQTSNSGDMALISELCQKIVNEYADVWMIHFQIEEDSIFQLFDDSNSISHKLRHNGGEVSMLCEQLKQEHSSMNNYYKQMQSGDYTVLGKFGELLKQHTRTEERQLFPLLDEILTAEELDRVYQTSVKYRQV